MSCQDGECGADLEIWPSCSQDGLKVDWEEEVDVTYKNCQPVSVGNVTHLCGEGGRREESKTRTDVGGVLQETTVTPCTDCRGVSALGSWRSLTGVPGLTAHTEATLLAGGTIPWKTLFAGCGEAAWWDSK